MVSLKKYKVSYSRGNLRLNFSLQVISLILIHIATSDSATLKNISNEQNIMTISLETDWTNLTTEYSQIELVPGESEFVNSSEEIWWWERINRDNMKHSVFYTVIATVAYIVVFIVGIIGNLTVIVVIARKRSLRTVTNLFILNLAVADFSVMIFCAPPTLLTVVLKSWILGSFMCKGVAYVQGVSVMASAYSLVAISIDRCKAICQHSITARGFTKKQTYFIIALIWLISLIFPLPWIYAFELRTFAPDGDMVCDEYWENENLGKIYFLVANLLCGYLLPLFVITIANLIILRKVSHRVVPNEDTDSLQAFQHIQEYHRRTTRGVGKTLGLITFTFLLSWLPLYALATRLRMSTFMGEWERNLVGVLLPLTQWLGYWNSCINPVIYAFYNAKFRVMCRSLLPKWVGSGQCVSVRAVLRCRRRARRRVGQGQGVRADEDDVSTGPTSGFVFVVGRNNAVAENSHREFDCSSRVSKTTSV